MHFLTRAPLRSLVFDLVFALGRMGAVPAGATGAFATFGPRGTQFIGREFAVTVFVELLQRIAGIGDFVRVNHPVVICVQYGHNRRNRVNGLHHNQRRFAKW